MKQFLKICLLCFVFLNSGNLYANSESFFVHIDKPAYFTGDNVWFKLYYPTTIDKLAVKVLLVDSNNEKIKDFFITSTDSDYLSGHFTIPYDYKTDGYRLIFNSSISTQILVEDPKRKTKSLRDIDEDITLAEISFPIINDLSTEQSDNTQITSSGLSKDHNEWDLPLKINANTSRSIYQTREKIDLNINVTSDGSNSVFSNLSISIIPKRIRKTSESGLQYISDGPLFNVDRARLLSKEIYLKGIVYNRGKRPVQLNVIGAYTDQLNTMYYTKSSEEGAFTLKFPDFYEEQSVQFLSYEKEITDFVIKTLPDSISKKELSPVFYNEAINLSLEESRKRKKLAQYFENLESNIEISKKLNKEGEKKSDVEFVVNEYEKFETVYDFFSELITPLQFKKVKGKIIASMNNPKSSNAFATKLQGNPLFIVDGKATRNADYAGRISMSNIQTIELFYSPDEIRKQFNILGLSGVVKINTLTPLFDIPKADMEDLVSINGIQQAGFFKPFTPKSGEDRVPHLYSTLYWNPEIKTDNNGKANISFFQSDDVGEYSIIIVAQDQNGKRGVHVIDYTAVVKK